MRLLDNTEIGAVSLEGRQVYFRLHSTTDDVEASIPSPRVLKPTASVSPRSDVVLIVETLRRRVLTLLIGRRGHVAHSYACRRKGFSVSVHCHCFEAVVAWSSESASDKTILLQSSSLQGEAKGLVSEKTE